MAIIEDNNFVCSYNGYSFPTGASVSSISLRPVQDTAGRTITHTIASLEITAKICKGNDQDTELESIRTALEQQGGELVYEGRGFGQFSINTAGNRKDLKWGPIPKFLRWKSLGGGNAAEITWQVEVALINCDNAPWSREIMEFSYRLSVSTDEAGYSTRIHSGRIIIPQTRQSINDRIPSDTADIYFERIVPPLLIGFKRKIQRELDESKSELSFVVSDEEQAGNPLPLGVVTGTASHELANEQAAMFSQWIGTISATYEFEKGVSRSAGWDKFLALANDRILAERGGTKWSALPINVRIAEPEIHGKSGASYSMTYRLLKGTGDAAQRFFMPSGGLYRPVPGTDWNRWSTSLPFARAPRGRAGLQHKSNDDVIIDLCIGSALSVLSSNGNQTESTLKTRSEQIDWESISQALNVPRDIDPIGSWVGYECRLVIEPIDFLAVHRPLLTGAFDAAIVNKNATQLASEFSNQARSGYPLPQVSTPPMIAQTRAASCAYLRLVGRAVRIGHEIPPPTLVGVANVPAYPANHPQYGTYFSTWCARYTTHPIMCAQWNLRYFVELPPGEIGVSMVAPPRPDKPSNTYQGTVR